MGFPSQEYWSGLPFSFPSDLSRPGIEPTSPALQVDSSLLRKSELRCKWLNLDYISAARGAMLHDLYLYTWHKEVGVIKEILKKHPWIHPKLALQNASKYFDLNDIEKDIIIKHMWPVTLFSFPKFRETFWMIYVDKHLAIIEKNIK